MPQSRDDDEHRRPRKPGDHVADRLDASRSAELRALVRHVLIVEQRAGDGGAIDSMLRAVLGRDVKARFAVGVTAAVAAIASEAPQVVVWRYGDGAAAVATDGIGELRQGGYMGPIVVVADALANGEAPMLRAIGALEVHEKDDLDSLRLAQVLLGAVSRQPPPVRQARGPRRK